MIKFMASGSVSGVGGLAPLLGGALLVFSSLGAGAGPATEDQRASALRSVEAGIMTTRPVQVERRLPLALSPVATVAIAAVSTSKESLARLRLEKPARSSDAFGHPGFGSTLTSAGNLTWSVAPNGTRVVDLGTGLSAFTAALRSDTVRPDAIAEDHDRGTVWFYGEDLYRYRIASGELHRFKLASGSFKDIRKVLPASSGLWLATESGVFLFDDAKETFKALRHSLTGVGARFTQAVAQGGAVWLASDAPRLLRISRTSEDRAEVAVSDRLPGTPAKMVVANDELWLLLGGNHGDSYRLAYTEFGANRLEVIAGGYHALRQEGGRLYASVYETVYALDPAGKTMTVHASDTAQMLKRAIARRVVLFAGSSYRFKDGSEVVEYQPFDISKGWMGPERDSVPAALASH